jgi:glycine C-acetyltransferase
LAEKYNALVFVDECHATGFFGATGRGTEEYLGVDRSRIHIINSTLGKALGGAAGNNSHRALNQNNLDFI